MKKEYLAEEIFEDIPSDPENVIMKIPPEILEKMGWTEGTVLDVKLENGAISIQKHE